MNENQFPQDDPIYYFKSNIVENEDRNFDSIFLGCPTRGQTPFVVGFGILLGIYFILTFFITNIVLSPLIVEGESMYPTLNQEYTITGNKYATDVVYLWRTQNVKYKDIVVFDASSYIDSNTTTYYIKRVVAVAGDTIKFVETSSTTKGQKTYSLVINEQTLIEDYINEPMCYRSTATTPKFITEGKTLTVPKGHIFVMGDNRNNSRDSRDLGFISTTHILGRVLIHIPHGKTSIHGIVKSIKEDYLF